MPKVLVNPEIQNSALMHISYQRENHLSTCLNKNYETNHGFHGKQKKIQILILNLVQRPCYFQVPGKIPLYEASNGQWLLQCLVNIHGYYQGHYRKPPELASLSFLCL